MGVFSRIVAALAGEAGEPDRLITDSTHLKAQRATASLLKKMELIGASALQNARWTSGSTPSVTARASPSS